MGQNSKGTYNDRRHSANSTTSSGKGLEQENKDTNTADNSSSMPISSDSDKSSSSKISADSTAQLLQVKRKDKKRQLQQVLDHSSSGLPVDANVVVTVTSPSIDNGDGDDDGKEVLGIKNYEVESGKSPNEQQQHSNHIPPNTSITNSTAPTTTSARSHGKQLVRQPSSIVDTEGFSDIVLGEINSSMMPFKDVHNESYFNIPHEEPDLEDIPFESLNQGISDRLDTEIITSLHADSFPRGSRGSTPSHSPVHKRKESNADRKNSTTDKVKPSHLWNRRSKNKSLQLTIPSKKGAYRKTSESVSEETESHLGIDKKPSKKSKKPQGQSPVLKRDKDKLGAPEHEGSDSSEISRASDLEAVSETTTPQSAPSSETRNAKNSVSSPAEASHSAFNFSSAASAMNAFRKMMHRKEQNNNEEQEERQAEENVSPVPRGEQSSAARRRWKMIFNVSKFETMVRTPQVPERVDESLFYNQNIKHPKARHRLVSSVVRTSVEHTSVIAQDFRIISTICYNSCM